MADDGIDLIWLNSQDGESGADETLNAFLFEDGKAMCFEDGTTIDMEAA